ARQALPVLGQALAGATETAARAGLQVGSVGLRAVADMLPEVGRATASLAERALPSVQQGLAAAGKSTKSFAETQLSGYQMPENAAQPVKELVKDVPLVVEGVGSALEFAAERAPAAESFLEYVAGKALPLAEAVLGVGAEVAQDASKAKIDMPMPTLEQIDGALKAVGLDVGKISADAAKAAGAASAEAAAQVQAEIAKKLPQMPQAAAPAKLAAQAAPAAPAAPATPVS
ncbi:unnamed protein product, partial [Prorocentrum cordatum]